MRNEFILAVNQICAERQLSKDVVLEAVEAALLSAYKRDYGAAGNVSAKIDPETGQAHIYTHKITAEEVTDPRQQISLEEARRLKPDAQPGDEIIIETTPQNFGRIAAQTAKQVILQRIREAERDSLYQVYSDQEGEIINGVVQSIDSHNVVVNLGKAEGVMPKSEQIPGERYRLNQRLRAYVVEVERTSRGPRILLSRAHRNMLRRLLELEVPEIFNGAVEIKAIAREPGSRSKVAVAAMRPGVDPVGSCVGMRGTRIQGIVNELNGEKIDVIEWNPDPVTFIAKALSPAQVTSVHLYEDAEGAKTALVIVPDRQLSLAIGKEGQNARLAAKLTGWRIDIKSTTEAAEAVFSMPEARPLYDEDMDEDLLARAQAILAARGGDTSEAEKDLHAFSSDFAQELGVEDMPPASPPSEGLLEGAESASMVEDNAERSEAEDEEAGEADDGGEPLPQGDEEDTSSAARSTSANNPTPSSMMKER